MYCNVYRNVLYTLQGSTMKLLHNGIEFTRCEKRAVGWIRLYLFACIRRFVDGISATPAYLPVYNMAARRTKIVTLKVSSEKLEKFPDLVNHQYEGKPKLKLTLKSKNGDNVESRNNSMKPPGSHDSQSPGVGSMMGQSKYAPIVRVGISGLTMNSQIVREIDTSGRKPSSWEKPVVESCVPEESDKRRGKKIRFSVEDLDSNTGVLSMKDVRGFKEHPEKDEQMRILDEARKRGRRVVQSFTGYLMLWPSWHKVKEGNIEKKPEYVMDREKSGISKGSGGKKNSGSKSIVSSEVPTRPETPVDVPVRSETPVDEDVKGTDDSGEISSEISANV